jgi:hypothetical protein
LIEETDGFFPECFSPSSSDGLGRLSAAPSASFAHAAAIYHGLDIQSRTFLAVIALEVTIILILNAQRFLKSGIPLAQECMAVPPTVLSNLRPLSAETSASAVCSSEAEHALVSALQQRVGRLSAQLFRYSQDFAGSEVAECHDNYSSCCAIPSSDSGAPVGLSLNNPGLNPSRLKLRLLQIVRNCAGSVINPDGSLRAISSEVLPEGGFNIFAIFELPSGQKIKLQLAFRITVRESAPVLSMQIVSISPFTWEKFVNGIFDYPGLLSFLGSVEKLNHEILICRTTDATLFDDFLLNLHRFIAAHVLAHVPTAEKAAAFLRDGLAGRLTRVRGENPSTLPQVDRVLALAHQLAADPSHAAACIAQCFVSCFGVAAQGVAGLTLLVSDEVNPERTNFQAKKETLLQAALAFANAANVDELLADVERGGDTRVVVIAHHPASNVLNQQHVNTAKTLLENLQTLNFIRDLGSRVGQFNYTSHFNSSDFDATNLIGPTQHKVLILLAQRAHIEACLDGTAAARSFTLHPDVNPVLLRLVLDAILAATAAIMESSSLTTSNVKVLSDLWRLANALERRRLLVTAPSSG